MAIADHTKRLLLALVILALAPSLSYSQAWPTQPVRIVVGFAPGGTADILARQLQKALSTRFDQPIVVENRGGASGALATAEVVRSASGGHTFGLVVSTHASLAAINRKLPYDTLKDVRPVAFVGSIPLILVVKPGLAARSLPDLVTLAKERPGALNFAFPGVGLSHHFAGELLKQRAGVEITAVPYQGTAPALTDVVSGQVDMTFATTPSVKAFIEDGRVRALASAGAQRSLPSVPTFGEAGYSDFEVSEWFGVIAGEATPAAVVERLNREINQAIQTAALQEWMRINAVQPRPGTPEQFRDFITNEIAKLKVIAEKANISGE